ncbi:XRE family transcriptional regulator [Actinacidiphila sp. DG2A-62]|uniref:helix-turn-helix domain-containing protein n=1 Tax=Actinacidiphila sp. DG2A-62 TaxID=3108821 RepID=UPI002DBDFBEE|nr:XRE family transcriptional regulator [Actinacidiphila sp. DG2A-62]MEC3994818.1 XRE family transcriptional regulator [Actinacidiphila sp. DG2A-62]
MTAASRNQRRARTGTITGYVLRLARESIPMVQPAFAEAMNVDLATVQGWETGRRPLANVKAGALLALKRRLPGLGAEQAVVRLLDAAMDADRIIDAALDPPARLEEHPLAGWVHDRQTAHMIAWAVNGAAPPAIGARQHSTRRGPVATAPYLPAGERDELLGHLRTMAEVALTHSAESKLLRRQALYLASYDRSASAPSWTAHTLHSRRGVLSQRGWTDHWAEARSIAAALARQGDPQPLRDFIERSMADDDTGEAANLNYWAYWLGAAPHTEPDDHFMEDRHLSGFDPVTLLRRLTQGMQEAPTFVDLYAHSLWALLVAQPWLLAADPATAAKLGKRATYALEAQELSSRSRRDLGTVQHLLIEQRT